MVSALIFSSRLIALAALALYAMVLWMATIGSPAFPVDAGQYTPWAVALWFLYVALRFGSPPSLRRLFRYARGLAGRVMVAAFGIISVLSIAYAALPALNAFNVPVPPHWVVWQEPAALTLAGLFALLVMIAGRRLAEREVTMNADGDVVMPVGTQVAFGQMVTAASRYPYRG